MADGFDAVAALASALGAVMTVPVFPEGTLPPEIGDGLVIVRHGDAGEPERYLGGGASWSHRAEVEIYAQHPDDMTRLASLAGLVRAARAAVRADRTLAGTVDDAAADDGLEVSSEAVEGAASVSLAVLPVTLTYFTPD